MLFQKGRLTNTDAYKKACQDLEKEAANAVDVIFMATVLSLYREYGWRRLRIKRFMDVASKVLADVGSDETVSMIQLCDKELGIEIRNEKNDSYLDVAYLNDEKWQGMKESFMKKPESYKKAYLTVMKQKMKSWMFPQITATILITLHRKEKWGYDRLMRFLNCTYAIREEFKEDAKGMEQAVKEETGIDMIRPEDGSLGFIIKE